MTQPSWFTKLDRAEHHLRDFEERLAPFVGRHPCSVTNEVEPYGNGRARIYRVQIPQPTDAWLPIVAGDLMFNVRSALDHLAVALNHNDRWVQFPIYTCDVDEMDPVTSTEHLHMRDWKRWRKDTKRMEADALAYVRSLQPWQNINNGGDPRDHVLAILYDLQNADKHRRLSIVSGGLTDSIVTITDASGTAIQEVPAVPDHLRIADGAMVLPPLDPDAPIVDMKVEGTVDIMLGGGPDRPFRQLPGVLGAMVHNARNWANDLTPMVP